MPPSAAAPAPSSGLAAKLTIDSDGRIRVDHAQFNELSQNGFLPKVVENDGKVSIEYANTQDKGFSHTTPSIRDYTLFVQDGKLVRHKLDKIEDGPAQIIYCDRSMLNLPVIAEIAELHHNATHPQPNPAQKETAANPLAFVPGTHYTIADVQQSLLVSGLSHIDATMNAGGTNGFVYDPNGRGSMRISLPSDAAKPVPAPDAGKPASGKAD